MHFKIWPLVVILLFATMGLAQPRKFSIPLGPPQDLMRETKNLQLQNEKTIQEELPPSALYLGLLGGTVKPSSLTLDSHGHVTTYDFNKPLSYVAAQFSHFPFLWHGRWGWTASVGYAYGEYSIGARSTALHLIPTELLASYRAEFSATQKVIPYILAGPTMWSYFQRGIDEYNSSGTSFSTTAVAGLSMSLKRLGFISSRNDSEILFQYQRQFQSNANNADWSGDTFQVGANLSL